MMFEHDHGLTVDAFAGPESGRALSPTHSPANAAPTATATSTSTSELPQSLNLWHNGETDFPLPREHRRPRRPHPARHLPVFEHIPIGTMRGTNPDGTRYHDPGIRYITYFNGGDAIHAFNRATFGTPQSLGCVELPLTAAANSGHTPQSAPSSPSKTRQAGAVR